MTEGKNVKPEPPKTSRSARAHPIKKTPTLSAWLAYYQHSAAFHAVLAGIDRSRHHEIPVLG